VHQAINFHLGANIYAAGWFIEEQNFGFDSHPFCQDYFLLIAPLKFRARCSVKACEY